MALVLPLSSLSRPDDLSLWDPPRLLHALSIQGGLQSPVYFFAPFLCVFSSDWRRMRPPLPCCPFARLFYSQQDINTNFQLVMSRSYSRPLGVRFGADLSFTSEFALLVLGFGEVAPCASKLFILRRTPLSLLFSGSQSRRSRPARPADAKGVYPHFLSYAPRQMGCSGRHSGEGAPLPSI